ncbi:hypothetical protein FVEN_g1015 [Fusarium venenatum]|uniref:Phospholipase C n=1 Tax=Fusarium venenatum TaxID=56646 RepID=A0A2L2TKA1_9HYPO|nr:uncharacterized protein FVRRES_10556 [Fusarium venenatum]KAG8361281.1 hypothetical protein FVEN_g1015 [Fusarium venenatum]CEI70479.1 unnamed protein product [Fusarium venenatum]
MSSSEISTFTKEQLSGLFKPPYTYKEAKESTGLAENEPIDNLQDDDIVDNSLDDDRFFEAAEHESVVFGVKLRNIHGVEIPATDHETWSVKASDGTWGIFKKKKEVKLTFGRIIALAGDFYSTHADDNRTPVCGAFFAESPSLSTPEGWNAAVSRFRSAVQSLKDDTDRNLISIGDLIDKEKKGTDEAEKEIKDGENKGDLHTIANAYHDHGCGIPTNKAWIEATIGFNNPKSSLYAWLSYINADHFGDDALTAYKVGHSEAMRLAKEAGAKTSDTDKANGLQDAYMHEAFCLHYLTDAFSSGHIRAPRRQIHNDDYDEQSIAATSAILGKETPIWDFQANYMHDNDSDTGLLVQNQLGQQWLCYGDKQFKESWDIVNRARIMNCVQASVDELYQDAFTNQNAKTPSDFNAVKHIPVPMLAAGKGPSTGWKAEWGGYDIHNPVPLWQVNSEDDKTAWTIRSNVNDHSVFSRKPSTLKNTSTSWIPYSVDASKECYEARDSDFRTKGSAPLARPIDGLASGGFIQIQDLAPGPSRFQTCVNFWGPVFVGIHDREGNVEDKDTFTLRNRIIDFDSYEERSTIQPLQCVKWHDKDSLVVYRLMLQQNAGKKTITLSGWRVKDISTSSGKDQATFTPDQSWAFEATKLFKDSPVTEVFSSANFIRALTGNFKAQAGTNLAILKFDIGNPVGISLVANDGTPNSNTTATDTKGVYNFVKILKTGDSDCVLLASFEKGDSDTTKMSLDVMNLTGDAPTVMKHQASISLSPQSSQIVLVGDLQKTGKDQIVALFDSPDNLTVRVNDYTSNCITETTKKHVPQSLSGFPLIKPFFSALVPSEDRASPNSLSILQVSLHEYKQKPHFIFRLTDTVSWTTKTSTPVEDRLASDPHYFHLKWIRCSRRSDFDLNTSNAILEVFSFYGVLGIRLFAPISEKNLANYQEIGMLQYMGQTSIGTGLGCEGDWGSGILTWGTERNDFVDFEAFKPHTSGSAGKGTWGMSATDTERPLVKGWDVDSRPGYKV